MIDLDALKNELRANPGKYAALADADAAALASVPVKTPRPYRVTFATVASAEMWGRDRAKAFKAGLRAAVAAGGLMAADADLAIGLMDGQGFNPADPESQAAAAGFVLGGLCTAEEADKVLYAVAYPAGGPVTAGDVAAARAALARDWALDVVEGRVRAVYAAFVNERLNPARSDPALAVPTYADFLADAQAGGQ